MNPLRLSYNKIILICLLGLGLVWLGSGCTDDDQPPETTEETQSPLTEQEQGILQQAIKYTEQLKNRLSTASPNGREQYFQRKDIENWIRQLNRIGSTKEVSSTMRELNQIKKTYYEVGYLRSRYQIQMHQVKRVDGDRIENIAEIAREHNVTRGTIIKFNPNDIDDYGRIVVRNDSLPKLVWYLPKEN